MIWSRYLAADVRLSSALQLACYFLASRPLLALKGVARQASIQSEVRVLVDVRRSREGMRERVRRALSKQDAGIRLGARLPWLPMVTSVCQSEK